MTNEKNQDFGCVQGASNAIRIDALEIRADKLESAIYDIRDKLMNRPNWLVVGLIATLSSATVGLLILLMELNHAS